MFATAGATRLRLTGGEPLLRRDLPVLVAQLVAAVPWDDLALTTNGILLAPVADALKAAGLQRITVSLDTLDPARFKALTRSDELPRVREGLEAAARVFPGFKIDTVVMRGVNEDEIEALVHEAARLGAEIRFIEYMDVGGATRWTPEQVFSRRDLLESLTRSVRRARAASTTSGWAPAARFRLPHGQVVGVISSTTEPFCATCDRSRLTADGMWYRCLYATSGTDLRARLRGGATDDELLRADHRDVAGARRSRRGGSTAPGRPAGVCADHVAEARPAPGNAHKGRIGSSQSRRREGTIGAKSQIPGTFAWHVGQRPSDVTRFASDHISAPLDERRAAPTASRVFEVADAAGTIARIHVPQPALPADRGGGHQLMRGRVGAVGHLVVGVKRGDVPRDVRRDAGEKLASAR